MIYNEELNELIQYNNTNFNAFSVIVSNPPYQVSSNNDHNNSANNIFQYFYYNAIGAARNTSMIFPGGRWLQRSNKCREMAKIILETADNISWYPNGMEHTNKKVFPHVVIRDGVSIVTQLNVINSFNKSEKFIYNGIIINRITDDTIILPLQQELLPIINKIRIKGSSLNDNKYSRNVFGLNSQFVEYNLNKVVPFGDVVKDKDNYLIAYLANNVPGSAKRVTKYWLDKDTISFNELRTTLYTSWKVCTGQGTAGKDPENSVYNILEANSVVGESWVIVGAFSDELRAYNYKKYLDSNFVKVLLAAGKGGKLMNWGIFVPNLSNYINSIDFSKTGDDFEEEIYNYFSLSNDERLVLEGNLI